MGAGMRSEIGRWGYRIALLVLRVWWVVRRPRSNGVRCVLRHGDAFVLVRHTYGDSRWMLPGGRLGRHEDPAQTAAREIEQELGVTCTGWRPIGYLGARDGYWRRSPGDQWRRHGTYFLEADVRSPVLRPRAMELREAGWFTLDRLPGDCSDALDIAIDNAWLR